MAYEVLSAKGHILAAGKITSRHEPYVFRIVKDSGRVGLSFSGSVSGVRVLVTSNALTMKGSCAVTRGSSSNAERAVDLAGSSVLAARGGDSAGFVISSFTEIAAEDPCALYAEWTVQSNLVTGKGNGVFGQDVPVAWEELAVILYRYAVQYK